MNGNTRHLEKHIHQAGWRVVAEVEQEGRHELRLQDAHNRELEIDAPTRPRDAASEVRKQDEQG